MSKRRVECEMISAGQPRPYADSDYIGIVSFFREQDGEFVPQNYADYIVKKHIKAMVHDFVEPKNGEKLMWNQPRLVELRELGEGVWRAHIVLPSTE